MADIRETCMDATNESDYATVCSSEQKWINKIKKLHEERPEEVDIRYWPEDNGGVIVAHVPKTWMKLGPPRQVNYTDEQKAAMAERLAAARERLNG